MQLNHNWQVLTTSNARLLYDVLDKYTPVDRGYYVKDWACQHLAVRTLPVSYLPWMFVHVSTCNLHVNQGKSKHVKCLSLGGHKLSLLVVMACYINGGLLRRNQSNELHKTQTIYYISQIYPYPNTEDLQQTTWKNIKSNIWKLSMNKRKNIL